MGRHPKQKEERPQEEGPERHNMQSRAQLRTKLNKGVTRKNISLNKTLSSQCCFCSSLPTALLKQQEADVELGL
ncbi:hypothetical protein F8388_018817 [Cannabis sativa]|uniref:Uncharacterized protein n=1 Tax=Cannabis sativa TaxID=3483 RepID=A0A7J6IA51_CANSA|nr:hypothetical protein F8388_018817 [Cannabis sativa]KAF4403560.1 hypothetical protein G4B88_002413 [Cannabis sativa]